MDYRYFHEPDLLKLYISDEKIEEIKRLMPESKFEKIERFKNEYNLSDYDKNFDRRNRLSYILWRSC